MNTPQNSVYSELSTSEQRERIQEMFPDIFAWVFDYFWHDETGRWYSLLNIENVVACYPNQLQDRISQMPEWFTDWNMVIVNLKWVMQWKIEFIWWNRNKLPKIENPILLSPWVIEYWEDEKSWEKYTQTTLRDTGGKKVEWWIKWLADASARTTVAWRNFSWQLHQDLEMENAEESPFLMQDINWEYVLVTHDKNYIPFLKKSIQHYLDNKYLTPEDPNYESVKSMFELKFKWVNYDDLWQILQRILLNDRFQTYDWKEWDITWIEKEKVQLWSEEWEFYVYHDKANNTIEYRAIREITWFPEWLKPVWRIPLRLFLESENQAPSFKNIKNIWRNGTKKHTDKYFDPKWEQKSRVVLVPTIEDVANKVNSTVNKPIIGNFMLWNKIWNPMKNLASYKSVEIWDSSITEIIKNNFANPDFNYVEFEVLESKGNFILKVIFQKWISDAGSSPYLWNTKEAHYNLLQWI